MKNLTKLKLSKYAFMSAPRNDVYLIFSGRSGKNIRLSCKSFDAIKHNRLDIISDDTLYLLRNVKVLVPENEDEFAEINKENHEKLRRQANFRKENLYLSIQPSASCQLACDYCGQEHKKAKISADNIHLVLNRIRMKLKTHTYKLLEIGWFGGEPLTAWTEMRHINRNIKDLTSSEDIRYISHITTNGYALTLHKYISLKNEFNCKRIEITLDGSKEFHDIHRFTINHSGSFDRIFSNLINIINSPDYDKDQCFISVRCNVDEKNIEGVIPLLKSLYDHNAQDKIFFYVANVVSWAKNGAGVENTWKKIGEKSTEYLLYMLDHGFKTEILPEREGPYMCLGTIRDSEMYDAYGNIFDCSETSYSSTYSKGPFALGNLRNQKNLKYNSILKDVPEMLMNGKFEKCRVCKFYPLCGGLCPLALVENEPRCTSFIYNIEDRMLIQMLYNYKGKGK